MSIEIVENCKITKSDSAILRHWMTGATNHTGVDIAGSEIYSMCDGVVVQVGTGSDNKYAVTVQYDVHRCVRYLNLLTASVVPGQLIKLGDSIGKADKFVHFEYIITASLTNPVFPVRIGTVTYYKYNPIELVQGTTQLPSTNLSNITIITDDDFASIVFTDSESEEFIGNRGEE